MELAEQSNQMGCKQQTHRVGLTKPVGICIRTPRAQIDRHGAVGCNELMAKNLLHVSERKEFNLDSAMSWDC